jgi:hypothetical protein
LPLAAAVFLFFFFRLSCFRTRIFSHKKSVIVG